MTERQRKKVTSIANSYSNKIAQFKTHPNYWSPLTSLVEELDEEDMYAPAADSKKETTCEKVHEANEIESTKVGLEIANTISKMEVEMDAMLAEFDEINNAIDDLLLESEDTPNIEPPHEESLPSGAYDTGATSSAGSPADAQHFIKTGEKSKKIFIIPNSERMPATDKMRMQHQLRHPADEMNIVPGVHTTLISGCKMADADYVTILDKNELNVYDGRTTIIKVSEKAVLKGYRCKQSGLWRIPLKANVVNENTDTLLIQRPLPEEAIAHVFELPSTEKNNSILSCCSRFPNEGNVVGGCPGRKLQYVARANCQGHHQVLPGDRRNAKRSHEGSATRFEVNENENKARRLTCSTQK